jgi:hypothetical protein
MTRSTGSQTSDFDRGSATSDFVLLATPTVLAFALVLSVLFAAVTKLEAIVNASTLAQKLASADSSTSRDVETLSEAAISFTFGRPLKQVVSKTSQAVLVCYDLQDVLGLSRACWHSFNEPQ